MGIKDLFLISTGRTSRMRKKNLTPRVLFFHGVDTVSNPHIQGLHISPENFGRQLRHLQKYYEIISMEEYDRRYSEHLFSGREVVITFDDGYRNNLYVAAPILKSAGIPFTVFISTDHITSGEYFPTFIARAVIMSSEVKRLKSDILETDIPLKDHLQRKHIYKMVSFSLKHAPVHEVRQICQELRENLRPGMYEELCERYVSDKPMDWNEVIRLHKEYDCTIGAHCREHFVCASFQDRAETFRQITESKKIIESYLNVPCNYFAYPNGNSCPQAEEALAEAGFKLAFTTANKRLSDIASPYTMPRYGVDFNFQRFLINMTYKPLLQKK